MPNTTKAPHPFPSFRTWLTHRTDAELAALFAARPELATPPPRGIVALTQLVSSHLACKTLLDQLSASELIIIQMLMELGAEIHPVIAPVLVDRTVERLAQGGTFVTGTMTKTTVKRALASLITKGVVWDDGNQVKLLQGMADAMPVFADLLPAEKVKETADAEGPEEPGYESEHSWTDDEIQAAKKTVGGLQEQPYKTLAMLCREWRPMSAVYAFTSPECRELLEKGLLVQTTDGEGVIPHHLARSVIHGALNRPVPVSPALFSADAPPAHVTAADQQAAAAALTTIGEVGRLLSFLDDNPLELLRSGAAGKRALSALAKEMNWEQAKLCTVLVDAYAAGLVAKSTTDQTLGLTSAADRWLKASHGMRWADLIAGWMTTNNAPWKVGLHTNKGALITLLSGDDTLPGLVSFKSLIIHVVAQVGRGVHLTRDQLKDLLLWTAPFFLRLPERVGLEEILSDMERLGLVAGGFFAGTTVARTVAALPHGHKAWARFTPLLTKKQQEQQEKARQDARQHPAGDSDDTTFQLILAEVCTRLIPQTTDTVVVLPDLTIIAPGPLPAPTERFLSACAELAAVGPAPTYLLTEKSVAKAGTRGISPTGIHAFLAAHSASPLPQTVDFLLKDARRDSGSTRTGNALGFFTHTDPLRLEELISLPELAPAHLRIIAPTVAVSTTHDASELAELLKAAGFYAAVEDAEGIVVNHSTPSDTHGTAHRIPRRSTTPTTPWTVAPPLPEVIVSNLNISQAMSEKEQDLLDGTQSLSRMIRGELTTIDIQRTLTAAAQQNTSLVLSFVTKEGMITHESIIPITIMAGRLKALHVESGKTITVPLHTISDVRLPIAHDDSTSTKQ